MNTQTPQPVKIKVSKEDRQLIETFMGYADGYLSEWIRWNDVMPVVEKIGNYFNQLSHEEIEEIPIDARMIWDLKICAPTISTVHRCVTDFLQWHNTHQSNQPQ